MNHEGGMIDLILLGCVKGKRDYGGPAQDVYASTLWKYRREYAESRGCPWYILSAKHGLLAPDTWIEPYDCSLNDSSPTERRTWSTRVLNDLVEKIPKLGGKAIEVHAGKSYVEYGLEKGLREIGVIVRRPLAHVVGPGRQVNWYQQRSMLSSIETPRG